MTIDQHQATCRLDRDGTWHGGCARCGVGFGREHIEAAARAWVAGHDAAINRARHVAANTPPVFARTGPGDALSLRHLRDLANYALAWAEQLGVPDPEILQPHDQPPILYLWTPPTEEGWRRERIGLLYIERSGQFWPDERLGDKSIG